MSSLFQELKRRNVFRVVIAYIAIAWLTLQVTDIVFENFGTPDWVMKTLMFLLAIGFPLVILFAWAYEMTPEGIKREKEVDRETSITRETGQKLNRTIIAVLVTAVAFLLVDKFMLTGKAPAATVTDKSVAVLPFVAMSRGPDDGYFADGLTEEILNSLTRVPDLLVTARTSAFHFKGKDIPVPEIAEQLGVAHVVEGSVRRDGDRLRVTAQLIRADDGFHLWSENYDRETADTFNVQTDIAEKIASALNVVLDEEQLEKMRAVGLRNPEAFVAYQKARELFALGHANLRNLEKLREANSWFEKALSLEPGLSDAYRLHTDYFTHVLMNAVTGQRPPDDQLAHAEKQLVEDFDNAIRTAPNESARLFAAFDKAFVTGNWRAIGPLFDQVMATPGCQSPGWFDMTTVAYGQHAAALEIAHRMSECDPLNFAAWSEAVQAHNWSGDFDAAIETADKALAAAPHPFTERLLTIAYIGAGRYEDAEAVISTRSLQEGLVKRLRVKIAAARGDSETTIRLLDDFAEFYEKQTDRFELRTDVYAIAGRRDLANAAAAEIDAQPYGYLHLMLIPRNCMCGAPWDLEHTPNFARLIEDANLSWPPASPINWPLKDY